jgi:hypothetical protein
MDLRCGLCLPTNKLLGALQCSELLYKAPNGDYRLIRHGTRFAVLVIRDRVVVTVVSLEQAFSNCPQATFYALLCRGLLVPALNMRSFYAQKRLPPAHGTDATNFKYPKVKAKAVWGAFAYTEGKE